MQRRILVLDAGVIITGYDHEHQLENGRFPAIIDKALAGIFKNFSETGYSVVIAAEMNSENLDYFKNEFKKTGICQFVMAYSPNEYLYGDSNIDILKQYAKDFFLLEDRDNIHFFDEAKNNVEDAKKAGFTNSSQVTKANTLVKQLSELLDKLGLRKPVSLANETINESDNVSSAQKPSSFSSSINMFPVTKLNTDETKSLLDANKNNDTSSCCCNIF